VLFLAVTLYLSIWSNYWLPWNIYW